MNKSRFIIVGSGWRSLFFVRIAKALPEYFEMAAMLCRTPEKAQKLALENDIHTTTSKEECIRLQPDFVVVAVSQPDIAAVSSEWMNLGFTVLAETPASRKLSELEDLWRLHTSGKKLVIAEQYTRYPTYEKMLSYVNDGTIGRPDALNLSLAHEYHGDSLMRAFLQEPITEPFTVSAKEYEFLTVETLTRYETFTDGRTAMKKRTTATFTFADGKVCWYDFDSEQYRSPIRKNSIKLQGTKGELKDDRVYYLDEAFEPRELVIEPDRPFEARGLSEDETAIAKLMLLTGDYSRGDNVELMTHELQNALQDSYMAILMQEALHTGTIVASRPQIWQEP